MDLLSTIAIYIVSQHDRQEIGIQSQLSTECSGSDGHVHALCDWLIFAYE